MSNKKKTILMNLFDSNMVRNIMRTNVLSTLALDNDIERIVILTHHTKTHVYREEFANDKIVIDAYPSNLPSFPELCAWFAARHIIHTKNVRAKINEIRDRARGNLLARYAKYLFALLVYYSSMIPSVDSFIRKLVILIYREKMFAPLMEKYRPDVVFLPTIFGNNDVRLLKYCKVNDIPTIGMIKSWDNLVGKDPLLIWPDRLIVHNEIVKGYAVDMHSFPIDRIFVSGIPQFDVYSDPYFVPGREEFFSSMGLDKNKKLIVYSAMGGWISLHEREVVEILAEIVNSGNELIAPAQLLVRLHPAYTSDDQDLYRIPNIKVVRPGIPSFERNPHRFDFEFHERDTKELAATLKYADVVLNSGSTMTIDAACFDTPIINIAFDGHMENETPERSVRRLFLKEHYLPIVESGGVKLAYNKKELVSFLNSYLSDKSQDREGRARIVAEQCYRLDGHAGERIGRYIIKSTNELLSKGTY